MVSLDFQKLNNKYFIVPKVLFLTMNLAYYCCKSPNDSLKGYAFRAKYLKISQGVSTRDWGILAGILPMLGFLAQYFVSYVSDRFGRVKWIMVMCALCSAATFQFFIIKFPEHLKIPLAGLVSGFYIFFISALVPMLDALVLKMLIAMPGGTKEMYGRQRLWGTLSYSIISTIVSSFGNHLVPTLNILVIVLSVFFSICAISLIPDFKLVKADPEKKLVEKPIVSKEDFEKPAKAMTRSESLDSKPPITITHTRIEEPPKKSGVMVLLTDPNFMFLLLVVFMNGLARATMTHFLEPIQRVVYRTPSWASGISMSTGVFFEVIGKSPSFQLTLKVNFLITSDKVFFFGQPLLRTFGVRRLLLFSQIAMCLRISCYAFIHVDPLNPGFGSYYPIFYELFKGMSFGFMQTAAVTWVFQIAGKDSQSTAQALYTGTFSGIAASAAGFLGYAVQSIGAITGDKHAEEAQEIQRSQLLVKLTAYVSFFALAVFFLKYIVIDEWMVKKKEVGESKKDDMIKK